MKDVEQSRASDQGSVSGQKPSSKMISVATNLGVSDLRRLTNTTYSMHIVLELDRLKKSICDEGHEAEKALKLETRFGNRDSYKRALTSPFADDVMSIIWLESKFVDEEAIKLVGLDRQFHGEKRYLNPNSIRDIILEDPKFLSFKNADAIKRSVDRVCDAMEVYGLINRTTIRDNLKPIEGTEMLHQMMMRANSAVADLLGKELNGARNV